MTEVARVEGSQLAIRPEQNTWDAAQIAALRQMGVNGAPDPDLQVFFHFARRTGLDPFARQVYLIGRPDQGQIKWTIQTGIDGFRLIADRVDERTKTHRGYEDTLWYSKATGWVDVWDDDDPPSAARVTVLRGTQRFPAVAHYREYVGRKRDGTPNRMWASMPANQLSKCAEALALRKAYPQDLSGVYMHEEMQQAGNDLPDAPVTPEATSAALVEFKDRALAATGDPAALQAIWQDARAAGLLDETVDHDGGSGSLSGLILHLRGLPKPEPSEDPDGVVDAEVVDEPQKGRQRGPAATPTGEEVAEALGLRQGLREPEKAPETLPCGCDAGTVEFLGGKHEPGCPGAETP